MRLRNKDGVAPGAVYLDDESIPTYLIELYQLIDTYWSELYVEPLKGQYNLSIFSVYFQCTVQ